MDDTERKQRRACHCDDCKDVRAALRLLDGIANSDAMMGAGDIDNLCAARTILADVVGAIYNDETNRYEV